MLNHQKIRCKKTNRPNPRPYECKICGKRRITKDDLRKHMLTHSKPGPVAIGDPQEEEEISTCSSCMKTFSDRASYVAHTNKKLSTCSLCDKQCKCEALLKVHQAWHDEVPIECVQCSVVISDADELKEHSAHHSGAAIFHCLLLGVERYSAESLKQMLRSKCPSARGLRYACEHCGKEFPRKSALADHVRTHTGERPYSCSICKRSFALKNTLKMHEMRHRGERPHTCSKCGKQFINHFMLKEHMRTHTGEKPFVCCFCGKRFGSQSNHKAHVRLHSGERPYQCSHCDATFTSKAKMHMHEDSHAGIIKHFCSFCNKGFVRKDSMVTHMRTHRTARKSWHCETCGNRYSSSAALKVHARKHQEIKPFECNLCGKPFTRSDMFKKHLEGHAKNKNIGIDPVAQHVEVISVPQNEGGNVEITVDDEDMHLVVDQQVEGVVQRLEIPIAAIMNGENTAMAVHESAQISIIRKSAK
jgi:hypothetical protein